MDRAKRPKRRGLVQRMASVLVKPQTYRLAMQILRLIDLVARIVDRWH
jgi:hypothetical protein